MSRRFNIKLYFDDEVITLGVKKHAAELLGLTTQALYFMERDNTYLPTKAKAHKVEINGKVYRKKLNINQIGYEFEYRGESVKLVKIEKLKEGYKYTYSNGIQTYPQRPYRSFNTMWIAYNRKNG